MRLWGDTGEGRSSSRYKEEFVEGVKQEGAWERRAVEHLGRSREREIGVLVGGRRIGERGVPGAT